MTTQIDNKQFQWIEKMLQAIDVGLVVVDQQFQVQFWNGFMENHSGELSHHVLGQNLFSRFPDLDEQWFRSKAEPVFQMQSKAFTIWEQRPYLFKFNNYRPITGSSEFMYQDVTLISLTVDSGDASYLCIMIYDVTDNASSKLELQKQGRTDAMTKLNNRGYWEKELINEYKRAKRYNLVSTLVMFDIDHFKKVNDTYGHAAGDTCIRAVANLLRTHARETDITGRYGGEEFAVILSETSAKDTMTFAERLRKALENTVIRHNDLELKITISLGIAEFPLDGDDYKAWIEAADTALYISKEKGRNRTSIHSY